MSSCHQSLLSITSQITHACMLITMSFSMTCSANCNMIAFISISVCIITKIAHEFLSPVVGSDSLMMMTALLLCLLLTYLLQEISV